MKDPADSAKVEAARQKTEDWIKKHLDDIERHDKQKEDASKTTFSSGIADDDSFCVDSDGEKYYNCRDEPE